MTTRQKKSETAKALRDQLGTSLRSLFLRFPPNLNSLSYLRFGLGGRLLCFLTVTVLRLVSVFLAISTPPFKISEAEVPSWSS